MRKLFPSGTTPKRRARGYTVLAVDDNESHCYVVTRVLAHAGFNVRQAYTGREALRLAESKPDAIVLDLNLPDINGFEVCRRLKANRATAKIPVVHLTSTFKDVESQQRSAAVGASAYIAHPVEPDRLVVVLKDVLKKRKK